MDDSQTRYAKYLNFAEKYKTNFGYAGDYKKSEIEMVFDVNLFPECERNSVEIMVEAGTSLENAKKRAQIGIFDESRWGVAVHQPLRLPNGEYTTFNRWLSWGTLDSGFAGIVIAPILNDGRLIFLKNFRNATRNWCLEFPRGGKDIGNSLIKSLKSELSEEIGAERDAEPVKIGEVFPDSSVLASRVEVYKVVVKLTHPPKHESTEAIKGVVFLKKDELQKIIRDQKYIDSDGSEYEFKDGYTLSALQLLNL